MTTKPRLVRVYVPSTRAGQPDIAKWCCSSADGFEFHVLPWAAYARWCIKTGRQMPPDIWDKWVEFRRKNREAMEAATRAHGGNASANSELLRKFAQPPRRLTWRERLTGWLR